MADKHVLCAKDYRSTLTARVIFFKDELYGYEHLVSFEHWPHCIISGNKGRWCLSDSAFRRHFNPEPTWTITDEEIMV